jgi:hypothetical protein
MKTSESSNVSRSALSAQQAMVDADDLSKLKRSSLYPFFDTLTQDVDLPDLFYFIQILWMILQTILLSLWIPRNGALDGAGRDFAEIVFLLTCFTPFNATADSLLTAFFIVILVLLVTCLYVAAQLIFHHRRRRFLHALLYPARFLIEILPNLMIFPAAAAAGLSAVLGLSGEDGHFYLYFGFSTIAFICYIVIGQASLCFLGNSPYIPTSPFAAFRIRPYRLHTLVMGILFFFSMIGQHFSSWFILIILALQLVCCIALFHEFTYRPFMTHWPNCGCLTLTAYGAIMDLVMAILRIIEKPVGFHILILIIAVLTIAGVFAVCYDPFHKNV